jgi:hypothetical protein
MSIRTLDLTIGSIAEDVARAIVRVSVRDQTARLSTPLLYPGGSMIGVEISRLRDGFLVTDAGGARREAGLLGGERTFTRVAPEIAERFGVRFDHNMIFDTEVSQGDLAFAVMSVANAAKMAVETTLMNLATTEHADYRASLWERLEKIYQPSAVQRERSVRGSTGEWKFDAVVSAKDHLSLFEIVAPHPNAVSSAVTKFLDISDLGDQAPRRIAVLTQRAKTPYLPVLSRTAQVVNVDDPDEVFRRAA